MKQKTLINCLVAIGALFLTMAVSKSSAQEVIATNGLSAVTLDSLVVEAMQKNPELNFYRAEIAAAKGDRRTAGTLANPEAEVQLGQKRTTDGGGRLAGEGLAWSVSVSQSFEYPGRLALRKAIANRQVELAELGFTQFKAALAAKVRSVGYALLIAQEKAQAAQEVSARGRELVEVLVQREPAGVTPLLETRIIEANIITLKRRASEASKAAQAALFELNQLRGQPLATPLIVANATLKFPSPGSVEELLNVAATNNFELQLRQVELAQQGFKVDLTRNERWPAIRVAPFYSQEKAVDTEKTIGIGVSVPLPIWNRNKGNIEVAQARQSQAAISLLLSQRQVERQLRERFLLYQSRLAEMSQWPTNAAEELRHAAELGDRHYRLGALPISTYTELQSKYLEALEAILDTQGDALESLQQLELLTGTPLLKLNTASQEKPEPTAAQSTRSQK
jgi:outer membrane protein, heavy metal efflux system